MSPQRAYEEEASLRVQAVAEITELKAEIERLGNARAMKQLPPWVPDSKRRACQKCNKSFDLFRRRHVSAACLHVLIIHNFLPPTYPHGIALPTVWRHLLRKVHQEFAASS